MAQRRGGNQQTSHNFSMWTAVRILQFLSISLSLPSLLLHRSPAIGFFTRAEEGKDFFTCFLCLCFFSNFLYECAALSKSFIENETWVCAPSLALPYSMCIRVCVCVCVCSCVCVYALRGRPLVFLVFMPAFKSVELVRHGHATHTHTHGTHT